MYFEQDGWAEKTSADMSGTEEELMGESTEEKEELMDPQLSGYKDKILPVNKSRLTLQRDLYFVGTTQRGYEVEYDVRYEEGCSPTETFLLSIGASPSMWSISSEK